MAWAKNAPETGSLAVGFSAGIAKNNGNLTETINTADKEMYRVKNSGRQESIPVLQQAGQITPAQTVTERETPLKVVVAVIAVLFNIFVATGLAAIVILVTSSAFNMVGYSIVPIDKAARFIKEIWNVLV